MIILNRATLGVAMLVPVLHGYGQILLQPGETWTCEVTSFPPVNVAPVALAESMGFSFAATFQAGGTFTASIYTNNLSEEPFFTKSINSVNINQLINIPNRWQDLQGFIRVTAGGVLGQVGPAIHLESVTARVNIPNQANGTTDMYSKVITPVSPPRFVAFTRIGNSLVFSGTNGASNVSYTVLSSTNLAVPLSNWVLEASGTFDDSGTFSYTNIIGAGSPQKYFILRVP